MILKNLFAEQQWRNRHREQTSGHRDRGAWWATVYGAVSQFVPPQPSPAGSTCPFSMPVSVPALQINSSVPSL